MEIFDGFLDIHILMIALSALLPCATIVLAILILRQTAVRAALAGASVAVLLWALGHFSSPNFSQIGNALFDTLILQIMVAAIMLPGLFFVEYCERIGAPAAMAETIEELNLDPVSAAIVISTGVGVLVESLTGFGVSLLVTVPLLSRRFKRHQIIGLALIGMCLMPWGALGVAAHLGSELANLNIDNFSLMIWAVSGPIALILPALCLFFVPSRSLSDVWLALCAGLFLSGGIGIASYYGGIEIAGAIGGILVIVLIALTSPRQPEFWTKLSNRKLLPYYLLIVLVLTQKFVMIFLPLPERLLEISSGRVMFLPLASPGLSLLSAVLISFLLLKNEVKEQTKLSISPIIVQRSWRPLVTIFLFLLGARLLVEIGATHELSGVISSSGAITSLSAVIVLGALSGFVTGSGVAGNALFMTSAAATGLNFDSTALFSSLQHSSAGHTAMAALPVSAILLAALPHRLPGDDQRVMRTSLSLSVLILFMIHFTGILLFYL